MNINGNIVDNLTTDVVKLTSEGGIAIRMINKTGSASVKGTVVAISSTTDNAVMVNPIDSDTPFGVIYDSGIADGQSVWVVTSGQAQVLLVNTVAGTRGYIAYSSATVVGRVDLSSTAPGITQHMREIGHTAESKLAGTNILCNIVLHFN